MERSDWQSIDEVVCDMDQIRQLQKNMVRHYDDVNVPWYMDGYNAEDKDEIIVAFGADDGGVDGSSNLGKMMKNPSLKS